jgi:predicted phosphodiesterase
MSISRNATKDRAREFARLEKTAHKRIETLEAEIARLRAANEKLQSALEAARASRIKLRLDGKARKRKGSKISVRVIIPDTHGCFIDQAAAAAMLRDIERLKPDSVILLGDHLDCGGFLAEHHTWGYVAESAYRFEDDVNATNQFLDSLQRAAPSATIEYLEGNHERRIEKWIVTDTLRGGQADAAFVASLFSCEIVLHLAKRGIAFFKQGQCYDGCYVPATIQRDNCHFTHGVYTGIHAARQHLVKYNTNIWFGHTHRMDTSTKRTVASGPIGAWNPGCMCQLQPLWAHQNLTDWMHGYGVQLVQAGMGHLNLQIPVIDGVSYLSPLIDRGSA